MQTPRAKASPRHNPFRTHGLPFPSAKVMIAKVTCYGANEQPLADEGQLSHPWAVMTITSPPVTLFTFTSMEDAYAWTVDRALAV